MKKLINRRHFLTTMGTGIGAAQFLPLHTYAFRDSVSESFNREDKYWIDQRFTEMKGIPWRKIHLDFHNTHHIGKIAENFNADQWGDQLLTGNVDSIVTFAKDMHGNFYYPSKYGPVHPGLSIDLLGEQVEACRKRNIKVYAYYCCAWDHNLTYKHPEWNMRKRDGSDYLPKEGETPDWTAMCLGNKDFVDLMADHVTEFMSNYELDGAWLDMAIPIAPECYCNECLRQIKAKGKDPYNLEAQREHQNRSMLDFHKRMKELVHATRPGAQVDFNDWVYGKVSERVDYLDNIDVEALPTYPQWGYFYAPAQIRYQRNFGLPVFGMTGRFIGSWADFGGLKTPEQFDVELASLVANAAHCDVGDQMPPDGILDKAVYYVLNKSFGRIKKMEPWLEQAAPVTEAALMIPAIPLGHVNQPFIFGLVKLMMEMHLQFDLVEPEQDWEKYSLLIIPDDLMPDSKTVERIHKFISKGGSVIVCHNGGLQADTKQSWLEKYGMKYEGDSPFKPAYYVTEDNFIDDMPSYEYVLYDGASQWKVESPAKSISSLGVPKFNRSAEHFTSHRQTPYDHTTEYSTLAISNGVGLIGFPVGKSYSGYGYWIYREAFKHLMNKVLPQKLIETNAPVSTEITVSYQKASVEENRSERYMVHIINYSPVRKSPQHSEMHDDPVALTDVFVKLNIPLQDVAVTTVVAGERLKNRSMNNGIEVTVPRILISEIVCFELNAV